ncbi:AAA family ATPase [Archangium violaceum]|uniref:AAA family ATPase n=1 Tax=Archangium violaceum TaxID=83451 RepID=UPI0037C072E0
MKSRVVVGIAGGIGSGKTQVARQLADLLGAEFASFGDYVRERAREFGLDPVRDNLQPLGERLINEMGWDGFVAQVLSTWSRKSSLVLDGIRHVNACRAVESQVSPYRFILVYLSVDKATRVGRLEAVRPSDAAAIDRLEQHSTEREVHASLPDLADLLLDGSMDVSKIVHEISASLSTNE